MKETRVLKILKTICKNQVLVNFSTDFEGSTWPKCVSACITDEEISLLKELDAEILVISVDPFKPSAEWELVTCVKNGGEIIHG